MLQIYDNMLTYNYDLKPLIFYVLAISFFMGIVSPIYWQSFTLLLEACILLCESASPLTIY